MTASILINGNPGPYLDAVPGTPVSLSNASTGGEITYSWSLVDQPPGNPTDTLTAETGATVGLTPRKEGSYLLELIVNAGMSDEARDRTLVAVRNVGFQRHRIPAANETTEAGSRGWATATNSILRDLDRRTQEGTDVLCRVDDPAITTGGLLVSPTGIATLFEGTTGERRIPLVKGLSELSPEARTTAPLGVVVEAVGGGVIGAGALVRVRFNGLARSLSLNSPTPPSLGWFVVLDPDDVLPRASATAEGRVLGTVIGGSAPGLADTYFNGLSSEGGGGGIQGHIIATLSDDEEPLPEPLPARTHLLFFGGADVFDFPDFDSTVVNIQNQMVRDTDEFVASIGLDFGSSPDIPNMVSEDKDSGERYVVGVRAGYDPSVPKRGPFWQLTPDGENMHEVFLGSDGNWELPPGLDSVFEWIRATTSYSEIWSPSWANQTNAPSRDTLEGMVTVTRSNPDDVDGGWTGNQYLVAATVLVVPAAAGPTALTASLPYMRTSSFRILGPATAQHEASGDLLPAAAYAGQTQITLSFDAVDNTPHLVSFHLAYRVMPPLP